LSAAARLLVIGALAAATVLAGCGEDDDLTSTTTTSAAGGLTSSERDLLVDSEDAIVDYCRRRALALTDPQKRPTAGQQASALEAVDAMVSLASEKPDAKVGQGVEVSLFLGDLTENLEGSNCDPLIVGRLQQGLASLPVPGG
jgi:hypothetical protein